MREIQVFLHFANFNCRFIKGLSKISMLLTSILKTTAILSSLESTPETLGKSKKEAENMNIGGTNIGRVKLTKSKTSKIFTKSKVANITLLRTAAEARLFLTAESKRAFT